MRNVPGPHLAEEATTLTKHFASSKEVLTRRIRASTQTQNAYFVVLAVAVLAALAATGCSADAPKSKAEPAAETKPAVPAVPEDVQDAAKTLLGSDTQVLLVGDLAKNGKEMNVDIVLTTSSGDSGGTFEMSPDQARQIINGNINTADYFLRNVIL